MKLSVVTVCRNAEKCIKKTIESVLNQTATDYEYIILDGASSDATISIVESYRDDFLKKGISYIWVSEPDNGIYDAMNKSLDKASGEWILFMNSGDMFYDEEVVDKLFIEDNNEYDIVYGDVLITENNKFKFNAAGNMDDQGLFSPICHQGMMTRTSTLKKYRYNKEYKLAADYDAMIRMHKDKKKFKKINIIVAIFEIGGISYKNSSRYLKEMYRARNNVGIKHKEKLFLSNARLDFYLGLREICKKVMKKSFYSQIRGWYLDKYSFK